MAILITVAVAAAVALFYLLRRRKTPSSPDQAARIAPDRQVLRTIEFSYLNKDGERSTRMVDVQEFRHYNFSGYCRLRQKKRTFRYSRIIGDIVDVNTGETVSLKELSAIARTDGMPTRTDVAQTESPESALFELFEERRPLLAQLGWLVQTDESGVALYRKPGPTRRTQAADVLINYQTGSTGRPWYLRSEILGEAHTFSELSELNIALDYVLLRSTLFQQLQAGQIPLDLSL